MQTTLFENTIVGFQAFFQEEKGTGKRTGAGAGTGKGKGKEKGKRKG